MTPALIRTLDWDPDKVRCSTCGFPWAEHPNSQNLCHLSSCGFLDYHCHVLVNLRALWWVKEEIRR